MKTGCGGCGGEWKLAISRWIELCKIGREVLVVVRNKSIQYEIKDTSYKIGSWRNL